MAETSADWGRARPFAEQIAQRRMLIFASMLIENTGPNIGDDSAAALREVADFIPFISRKRDGVRKEQYRILSGAKRATRYGRCGKEAWLESGPMS